MRRFNRRKAFVKLGGVILVFGSLALLSKLWWGPMQGGYEVWIEPWRLEVEAQPLWVVHPPTGTTAPAGVSKRADARALPTLKQRCGWASAPEGEEGWVRLVSVRGKRCEGSFHIHWLLVDRERRLERWLKDDAAGARGFCDLVLMALRRGDEVALEAADEACAALAETEAPAGDERLREATERLRGLLRGER